MPKKRQTEDIFQLFSLTLWKSRPAIESHYVRGLMLLCRTGLPSHKNTAFLCWQEITSESTKCWRPWGEILVGWRGTACETAVWWTEKGKMGGEKRGMRTEAPGIRQSPLTKHCLPRTHISFPPLSSRGGGGLRSNNAVYLRLLPMSARPQTRETVLIPASGCLALVTNTPHTDRPVRQSGRETLRLSTVQKNPLNWSLFCGVLFAWE